MFGDSTFYFIQEAYALSCYERNMKLMLTVCSSATTGVAYRNEDFFAFQMMKIVFMTYTLPLVSPLMTFIIAQRIFVSFLRN